MLYKQQRKKYDFGGVVGMAAPIIDSVLPEGSSPVASGLLKGAASGAAFGPWGAAVGGAIGLVGGLFKGKAEEKRRKAAEYTKGIRDTQLANDTNAVRMAADPSLYQGYRDASYFKNGGSLTQKSSDGIDINGASHEQGGVQLPMYNSEVEGGETIKDDYVFSKELGFAQLHRPLMNAKGKIEKKPVTKDRLNSIRLIEEKEGRLMKAQEFMKLQLGK